MTLTLKGQITKTKYGNLAIVIYLPEKLVTYHLLGKRKPIKTLEIKSETEGTQFTLNDLTHSEEK
jgi:hypothetical protein